ncbi:MAG: HYR domain-containing protein, partial [Blastocatellia bacterium]
AVVLPMRLNADALSDLVILRRGRIAPTVMIAAPALNFVVSNTGDNGGVNPAPGAATGTLRQAIVDANANAGADTISFSIGAGAQTISLAAQLPIIADPVTIDGTTQPGFAGTPIIELIGGAAIPSGLTIDAGNSTVKGLVINSFILAGILLQTNGGNIVEGNYLGTELNGSIALPNGTGITIDGVPNNRVGGTTAAARNVISGNAQIGIFINGSAATGNIVQGNFIGTNAAGTAGLGNAIGISVSNRADATIGGTAAGARNIISANGSVGIALILSVSGTLVQGNFIGTDINGVADLGNNEAGVQVSNSSPNNTLGGTTAAARNIVSGNNNKGFQINGSGTNGNLVQGNFIGTQVDGNTALGNTLSGVSIEASATNNTVGGSLDSVNIIAFNGTDGVAISSGSGNAVLFNSIFSNANLGINISDDPGVTPNDLCDPDPGPNGLQNFPVLTSANSSGGNTVIVGTLNSTDATTFKIEFFSSPACDPSGNGEGKTFIGFTNVSTPAAICDTPINVSFPVTLAAGSVITATATDPSNSTSEFSPCVTVAATCVITCPPNQTQSNDPNQCGAVVTYPPPTADVSCGTVTCIPASGSFFPTGTTTVNCTTGAGPSCSFTVTVNDTQAPTITCPPAQTVPATSPAGAVVNYPAPTVSDNCPNASPACSPPSGSTFPVGSTTVNCTATDDSTNTSSCSFTVNVTAQADLGVTNVDSPDPVMAGSNLTYTITVTNGGPQPATNVALSTSVPTGTAFVSASVSQGTFTAPAPGSSGPVNWTVGTITLGSSATMTLIVNVTAGPTITNNATVSGSLADPNPANNSATAITTVGACALACPADVVFGTGPNATGCGAVFSYSAVPSGSCGAVTCAPPSGSVFIVGTTAVSCTVSGGPSCSFNVTVIDDTAPRVFCSGSLSTSTVPGQSTALVNYPAATVTDNCSGASVECAPPSGTRFPIGSTIVTCTGTDSASNTTRCSFNIIVIDSEGPIITCPANVSVAPASGQNSIVVTYPAPTVTDNLPGVSALCAPSSGSSFPVGVTTVTCVATDAQGNKASCAFSVSVGGPLARVIIPGGKTAIEFGTPTPVTPSRKPPKPKKKPCSFLSIENIGFAPLVLTLDSIARVGSDVDSKKISDPNDAGHFSLSLVNADQSLTPVDIGGVVTIPTGRTQTFCLQFSALIPALAGKSTGLTANEALPDTVNARITFRQNAGSPLTVSLLSHVSTALILIDPTNPRRPAVVGFTRSGNEITVSFAVFDPNLDVSRAKYEFLDNNGSVVGEAFEIDLAEPVRALNLVRGQSFSVEQKFTNAADHPEITGVRLTVFDAETSVTAPSSASTPDTVSIRLIGPGRGVTLYPPTVSLSPRPR